MRLAGSFLSALAVVFSAGAIWCDRAHGMQNDVDRILEAAQKLSEPDRIRLTERLLELFGGDAETGAADGWAEVISRRSREMDAGLVQPMSWSEVREGLRRSTGGG